jgi:hypothetical protein
MSQTHFTEFNRSLLDPEAAIARIGQGEVGGKAHGLASIREILAKGLDFKAFAGMKIDIPPLAVLCTDTFDAFLKDNHLEEIAQSDLPDDRIAHAFQKGDLPFDVLGDLRALANQVHTPLAIRSSSLLEDSKHEPFAGVYATKMIPCNRYDADSRFRQIVEAVKFVYASTYTRGAKDYRTVIGHKDEEERMGVIIQELVGRRHPGRFYPELSGVARSYNFYPVGSARPEEGVVSLALGLGKTIVDGGLCWSYSPAYPKVEPPFGSVDKLLKGTQTKFWVVNMNEPLEYDPTRETEYLLLEDLPMAERDGTLRYIASTYSPLSGRLSIGTGFPGPRALTFAPLLVLEEIRLNDLLRVLLESCESAFGAPVEIEFAMTFDPLWFGFLQVRTMEFFQEETHVDPQAVNADHVLVSSDSAMGNGVVDSIYDIVYTRPGAFDLKNTAAIVPELEKMNRKLVAAGRPYVLIVLGRLGTTDPWLGIPIQWAKISGARVVVEATQENVRVELSQGSHFFHNIVSLGVKYFNLAFNRPHKIDWDWLERQDPLEETTYLRHTRLHRPLEVRVDGRKGLGVINKPVDDRYG